MAVNYEYIEGNPDASPLLLLHGTGGSEKDLLPIGRFLAPDSSLLSIRGRVVEDGQNRYFKHTADGGFDLDNLQQETDWLFDTLNDLCQKFNIDYQRFVVVGYSNGANVAARALLTRPDTFHTGVLFHPMALATGDATQDLTNVKLWLSHGDTDPIVSEQNFDILTSDLKAQHADLSIFRHEQSHNLNEAELSSARTWLQSSGRLGRWRKEEHE